MSGKLPGLDEEQVRKAVIALLKYIGKNKSDSNDLFDDDEFLYLVIALKKVPQDRRKDKPLRLPLPHPIYDAEGAEICLLVKDRKGEGHKAAKLKVREEKVAGVNKVIGISKLKTKYESHESKRQLCSSYDLFLADDRILPSLPKLLGKSFFKKKKQPIPVRLTGKDWGTQVQAACGATYLILGGGSSIVVKVARSSQTAEQCVQNTLAVVREATHKVPRKWAGVKALFMKTSKSVALPVYQAEQAQRGAQQEQAQQEVQPAKRAEQAAAEAEAPSPVAAKSARRAKKGKVPA